MPSNLDLASNIARNSALICKAPNCYLHRHRVGGHCFKHGATAARYGHPHGRPIQPKEYAVEFAVVSAFIDAHKEHAAIAAATTWLNQWLLQSYAGDTSLPAHHELARLCGKGLSAVEILNVSCALFLYSSHFPSRLPDDERLTYAMSRAVLSLAPPDHAPSPSNPRVKNVVRYRSDARRGIGQRLRSNLAALFANMTDALDRAEMAQRAARDALRIPFIGPL